MAYMAALLATATLSYSSAFHLHLPLVPFQPPSKIYTFNHQTSIKVLRNRTELLAGADAGMDSGAVGRQFLNDCNNGIGKTAWSRRRLPAKAMGWRSLMRNLRSLRYSQPREPQAAPDQHSTLPHYEGLTTAAVWTGLGLGWLRSFREWLTYKAQLFLISPFLPTKVMAMLGFSLALVAIGGIVYKTASGEKLHTSAFKAFSLLNNAPGTSAVDETTPLATVVTNCLYMTGLFTFSVFLGVIASEISSKVDEVEKGNFRVVDSGHTLILNWNRETVPILQQIALAKREGRQIRGKPVVVLADKDKEEMDEEIRLGFSGMESAPLTVITRRGLPSSVEDLDLVCAAKAKRSIILRPGHSQLSDNQEGIRSRLMVQSVALQSVQEKALQSNQPPLTVVHFPVSGEEAGHVSSNRLLSKRRGTKDGEDQVVSSYAKRGLVNVWQGSSRAKKTVVSLPERMSAARLIGQCLIQPGVSVVHADILQQDQGEGVELYFEDSKCWPWLLNKTYQEVGNSFVRSILCGVYRPGTSKGSMYISPPPEFVLQKGDRLLFLADNRKSIRPLRKPMIGNENAGDVAAKVSNGQTRPKCAMKSITLINWNPGMAYVLTEIDAAAERGTRVNVLVDPQNEDMLMAQIGKRFANIRVSCVVGNSLSKSDLISAKVGSADTVIVLQDQAKYLLYGEEEDGDTISKDSHALTTVVLSQEIIGEAQSGNSKLKSPHLIAEFHSRRSMDIVNRVLRQPQKDGWAWGALDMFIPEELDSGMLVQCTLDPLLTNVYDELLRPQGWEVFMFDPAVYGYNQREGNGIGDKDKDNKGGKEVERTTFFDLSERARARGHIAIGIERHSGKRKSSGEQGSQSGVSERVLTLNPHKRSAFDIRSDDRIIVFARLEKEK